MIVSTAARAGRLGELGKYVLKTACRAASSWPEAMFVSINLTAADFRREDLYETVLSIVEDSGLSNDRLRIEITEIEYLEITPNVLRNMENLKGAGIKIGVDDFGTGYSSMGSIDKFPADFVKIDRSLIQNCNARISSKIFLRAIQLISQNTGTQVVAEGIETLGELAVVRSVGITLAQGYYYAKAMPEEALLRLLGDRSKRHVEPTI
jgi:EAL domain-containing protein (putative c-di-GMP-specific phosphodiesterase class I)